MLRQGGDIKKKNPWVKKHVQEFAKENNIGYLQKHYQILIVNPNEKRNNGV
jgi:hypothetical protein